MTLRDLRERRRQIGTLWALVHEAGEKGNGEAAEKIFDKWLEGKLSYRRALEKLKKLAGKSTRRKRRKK